MPISKSRQISKLVDINGKLKGEFIDSDFVSVSGRLGIIIPSGMVVVSSADTLPVTATNGDQAFVTSTNRLYVYSSSGWYNIGLINSSPYWITEPDSDYTLELISIDSDVKIVVLAGDSDNTPLTYIATVDSDFNVAATITHDSDRDNVWIISRRDSELGAGTTGNVTFKASDSVNLVTFVSTFTIPANTIYEFLGTLESVYSGTVLNLDSDMETLISANDVLTNAIGGSGSEATVSSVTFLDNTYASRTSTGSTNGVDQGSGYVAVPTGNVDSDNIGWVWNYNSDNNTAASYFRTGNQYGGQIITNINEQPAVWAANSGSNNLSAMYIHGAVGGSYYRSYPGVVCTQYTLSTNGGATRKGTIPMYHSGNSYTSFSPYSDGKKSGSDHFITMKVDGLVSGNQGVNYNWPVKSYTANWNYRNVTIRSNNTSSIGGGTSMQTSMVLDGNQSSNFQVGGVVHIGENSGYNQPTNQEVFEGKFFTIAAVCYFSNYGNSSPFNMTTSYGGGSVSMWSGANSSLYFGTRANRYQTGIILVGNMGYTQSSVWGSTLQTSISANGINQNVPMYTRNSNLCNQVYIISPDYPLYTNNHNFVTSGYGTDLRPSYSEWSSTNNVSGSSFGNATYPIYTLTSDAATQLQLAPSTAGDGTNVSIGTNVYGSYIWKNVSSAVVDDTTGFTAGDNIYKKIT